MGDQLIFSINEKDRQALDEKQYNEVKKLYAEMKKDLNSEIKRLSTDNNMSSRLKELQLKRLKNEINDELKLLDEKLVKMLEDGMDDIITETCKETDKWLQEVGFKQINLLSDTVKFHKDTIETIVSGQLYDSKWSLSKAIWGNDEKNIKDINSIIAKGIGENKSSYAIAKDLERYVNPSARKSFNWGKVYPGTNKKIDYNAQRLARTMTSHAYQEATIRLNKDNPFTKGIKWETSNSHTEACEICKQRATQDEYNLGPGVFPVDKVPLDHPNGKCTLTVVSLDMDEVRKQVADWYNAPEGTYPDIDKFARSLGYDIIQMPADIKEEIKDQATSFNKDEWNKAIDNNEELLGDFSSWTRSFINENGDKVIAPIKKYTGDMYIVMNTILRAGADSEESIEAARIYGKGEKTFKQSISLNKKLESVLSKASLLQDVIVRRGSNYNMLQSLDQIVNKDNYKNLIGGFVEDKGFLSTSPLKRGGFHQDYEYIIKLPKGSQALYIGDISVHKGESEMLLNCGGKFIIEDIELNEDGSDVKRIYMSLINLNNER